MERGLRLGGVCEEANMPKPDFSRLSRSIHPMPDWVREALEDEGLMEAYRAHPAYQQNDYLSWIGRGNRPATQVRRLAQMLDELRREDAYMKMAWYTRGARPQ